MFQWSELALPLRNSHYLSSITTPDPLARPGTERGAILRLRHEMPRQSSLNALSRLLIDSQIPQKSLMTILVPIIDQLIFTKVDFDDEFVEVVNMLLEGAGRMTRNGKRHTNLNWKNPFPASSFCAPHAALHSTDPHPRQSSC
ncbi:hypothetical protein BLNAU_22220 [Blattamonas nauphoetae]|uniref:Uncharacterized protein n=1 Tax=Blattamonas nauphoetae TaxID=2049346 RepID=A0ABQ9WTN4_9EUKA|nr:hypothetical protein BLNAU_22220 [Blattamonas nauphoetae]